jgi:hypothetical protein
VAPEHAAFVVLNHYRCDNGSLRGATHVVIGSAGAHATAGLALTITDPYKMLSYCGAGDPGSTLAVSPFEPSLRAALG